MESKMFKRRLALPLAIVASGMGGSALAGIDARDIVKSATLLVKSIDDLMPEDSFCVSENPVSGDPAGEPATCNQNQDSSYITG